MASRNGLNPKIRGPKGVGFGRALPAPFGFDLSFQGDGIDDYFDIPNLIGQQLPNTFTVELWIRPIVEIDNFLGYFSIQDAGNNAPLIFSLSSKIAFSPDGLVNLSCDTLNMGDWNHLVYTCDFLNGKVRCVTNGNVVGAHQDTFTSVTPQTIIASKLYANINGSGVGTEPIDEFRFYSKIISDIEITTNYNSGIGNNPSITEDLLIWYKFEQFELLDFSDIQDNSDIQLAVKDMSGKHNHGGPKNMVTDPTSPNYVLKSF